MKTLDGHLPFRRTLEVWLAVAVFALILFSQPLWAQKSKTRTVGNSTTTVKASADDAATQTLLQESVGTPDAYLNYEAWAVCDAGLRQDIRRAFAEAGKRPVQNIPSELRDSIIVIGLLKTSGIYDLFQVICDGNVFAKPQLRTLLNNPLQSRLSQPMIFSTNGAAPIPSYCHKIFLPLQKTRLLSFLAKQPTYFPATAKQVLLNVPEYAGTNLLVFAANYTVVSRMRELITPSKRTEQLEKAEQECDAPDLIKKYIRKNQPVPADLLVSQDCKIVFEYYSRLAKIPPISNVYVLAKRPTDEEKHLNKKLGIIGVVSLPAPTKEQQDDPDYLRKALVSPLAIGTLTASELQTIPTQVFTTDSKGTKIYEQGSIENTSAKTMLEYISTTTYWRDATNLLRKDVAVDLPYLRARLQKELENESGKK